MSFNVGVAEGYLNLNVSGWNQGLSDAQTKLNGFQGQMSKTQSAWNSVGKTLTKTGKTLTTSVTLPLVGLGTAAVKTTASFESAMSQVQATMGITADSMDTLNGQSVNTLNSLSALAQELGANTKFSAVEAAEAINNMAMAGYSVQEICDALPQVLSLASAGALDLDYATQLVANGLNVMGMETSDASELADKLAVTATKAYGSVSDFGEGLLVAGAQAKLANVSLTDTMTALGILGDNGISASEGGTYLRNTLKNLYTPTEDAAKALKELGVETANSDGTLRDFQDVLQDLGKALDGLTPDERIKAMKRIFDTRTISAANALIENAGERWDELSESIDNATGAADRMADVQLNNLQGQLTILKSSLEGLAISFGSLIVPIVKQVTNIVQEIVSRLNQLDDAQKEQIIKIAAIVAAIGPILLVLGKTMTAISGIGKALSLIASPTGVVLAAVLALVGAFAYLLATNEEFRESILATWDHIKSLFQGFFDSLLEKINSLGYNFENMAEVMKAVWDWLCNSLAPVFEGVFQAVSIVLEGFLNSILDIFDIIVAVINGDWSAAWEGVKNLVTHVFETIKEVALLAWEGIKAVWVVVDSWFESAVLGPVKQAFSNAWNAIKSAASIAWDAVKLVWGKVASWYSSTVLTPMKEVFSTTWNAIKLAASTAWDAIKVVWSKASSWFSASVLNPLKTTFSNAWNAMKQGGSNAWESIKSVFSAIPDWFRDKFSTAWQAVKDVFSTGGAVFTGITEGITAAFKQVVNAIIGGINQVVAVPFNALNNALDKLRVLKIAGVQPFGFLPTLAVPQIPLLAQGGVLKRGQIGLLEGTGAEAVVPLEKNTGWIKKIAAELFTSIKDLIYDSGLLQSIQYFTSFAEDFENYLTQKNTPKASVDSVTNNYYNFYSPKEIDPLQARKMMLQTAQQLALN